MTPGRAASSPHPRKVRQSRHRRWPLAGLIALVVAGVVVGLVAWPGGHARAAPRRPNIVFVMTDDLDSSLVNLRYMPHVIALGRTGVTFDHYIVSDSLCCPSRSSILTGLFPHDSGVYTNTGSDGGYFAFTHHKPNLESRTFPAMTQRSGYLNSMMGKYLNGYGEPVMTRHVPPGWSDWHVAANAYAEFGYSLNENRLVVRYGPAPPPPANAANYLTDVLSSRARSFIDRAATARRPFVLEVATFAPHNPYTPAPRNANDFPGLGAPRDPSFNTENLNAPDWLGKRKQLTSRQVAKIDAEYRKRAQSVEAVDQLLAALEAELSARGLADNTYIVFGSDNGFHMGQHRLLPGKQTAFDTDIRVPLIIAGPGVSRNQVVSRVVQNIDLYPTFLQIAGRSPGPAMDGHSLLPLLHQVSGKPPPTWRTVALIEHHGPNDVNDPDFENGEAGGNPSTYEAIRLSDRQFGNAVYIEYTVTGKREYYNINQDPLERNNTYTRLDPSQRKRLHNILIGLERCHSVATCWTAGKPQP